jgi:exosortase A-associated hydrolase 1
MDPMSYREVPVVFECDCDTLVGIASVPPTPKAIGVLIVVGGPQYRVGSHRMFVLLARALAEDGYAAFRFDYRGMGDSSGAQRTFEDVHDDIACAARAFRAQAPQVTRLVLWGLCDAASAALISVDRLPDVAGLVLANPWVRSEQSHNQAMVRHYYANRLLEPAFWSRLFTGRIGVRSVLREFVARVAGAFRSGVSSGDRTREHFSARMLRGWQCFQGKRLVILSGQDLTAREFEDLTVTDSRWSLSGTDGLVSVCRIEGADHTFSSADRRAAVARATTGFLESVLARAPGESDARQRKAHQS